MALLLLVIFVGLGTFFAVPLSAQAAECGAPALSAGGFFFTDYENIEYSSDGYLTHHFKISPSWADGRPFSFSWSYYDDECNPAGSLGVDKIISLPPGVTDWSVRFTSTSHADIWNDQASTLISGIDFPAHPAYTSVTLAASINGSASTLNSRTLKINQNANVPVVNGTLPLPDACASSLLGAASGSSQYFFDSYEHAEYVDGFLRVHLRLKTPYNDGRSFRSAVTAATDDCVFSFPFLGSLNTSLPAYARYFSFRMTSETHWELWNDETNQPISCTNCSGDLPIGSKYAVWFASIDGGVSAIQTTPFAPVEHTEPVYAECCSSVVFLPGIESSVLKDGSDVLWPPTLGHVHEDMQKLFLNADGSPVDPNVTVDGILNTFPVGPISAPVYQSFTDYMDSLVSSHVIKEWEPLPYDWRYGPEQILTDGVATPTGTVDLVHEVEQLALRSDTGKVTIVAHSMGGLMGKALIKKLIDKGEGDLIDSFVIVASPQLGTPQAVAGLLHGEGSDITWDLGPVHFVIVDKADPRALGQNMQSAYNLLPSPTYYQNVIDAPVFFSATTTLTASWRGQWGIALGQFSEFFDFLTGNGSDRTKPAYADVQSPEILRSDLLSDAINFHNQFDSFSFPANIHVVQIAGWGLPTVKGTEYVESHGQLDYKPVTTSEGDGTVVYPSAISSTGDTYFFNIDAYNDINEKTSHRDLVGTIPVLNTINSTITNSPISTTQFLLNVKPNAPDIGNRLLVGVHSPVTIGVYDGQARFTGVTPNQDVNTDIQLITKDIPGSDYFTFGDGKYILLPQGDTYTFTFHGTGNGPATVDVRQITGDTASGVASYTDIPVTPATSATLTVVPDVTQTSSIQIDQNGDGKVDSYAASDGGVLSVDQLLVNLTTAVQNSTIKEKLKTQLLNKVITIQKKIDKQKQKQSNLLAKLQTQLQKQMDKGKIDTLSAAQISALLEDLISQSMTIPLDSILINQLRDQINALTAGQSLKNSLLAKLNQLQNLAALTKSLASFTQTVVNKANKGQIADPDLQNVLNILDQIQSTL